MRFIFPTVINLPSIVFNKAKHFKHFKPITNKKDVYMHAYVERIMRWKKQSMETKSLMY